MNEMGVAFLDDVITSRSFDRVSCMRVKISFKDEQSMNSNYEILNKQIKSKFGPYSKLLCSIIDNKAEQERAAKEKQEKKAREKQAVIDALKEEKERKKRPKFEIWKAKNDAEYLKKKLEFGNRDCKFGTACPSNVCGYRHSVEVEVQKTQERVSFQQMHWESMLAGKSHDSSHGRGGGGRGNGGFRGRGGRGGSKLDSSSDSDE